MKYLGETKFILVLICVTKDIYMHCILGFYSSSAISHNLNITIPRYVNYPSTHHVKWTRNNSIGTFSLYTGKMFWTYRIHIGTKSPWLFLWRQAEMLFHLNPKMLLVIHYYVSPYEQYAIIKLRNTNTHKSEKG